MKAIVNTKSNYRNLNGLTFPVKEFMLTGNKPGISLLIPKELPCDVSSCSIGSHKGFIESDFSLEEVRIVNLRESYQKAYDDYNWGGYDYGDGKYYQDLKKYCELTSISFKPINQLRLWGSF